MGAWSYESFGNDDACDWAAELVESDDFSPVEAALDRVLKVENEYLESPEASQAIAAVEVIARLQGNWGLCDSYSEAIDAWVKRNKFSPSMELVRKAHRALDRIVSEPCELLDLWGETEDFAAWRVGIQELRSRVRI